jgi:hypothetical protein
MGARLPLVQFSLAPQPTHVAVVVGDLGEAPLLRQVIDAAVAYVAEIHPPGPEPAQAERGAHSPAFRVGQAELSKSAWMVENSSAGTSECSSAIPAAECRKMMREKTGDPIRGDAAREFPRTGAAHAVAHRKDEVGPS